MPVPTQVVVCAINQENSQKKVDACPRSSLQDAFEALQIGTILSDFYGLLKPIVEADHSRHIAKIGAETSHCDTLFGVDVATCSGVYRPHINSSSVFLLRAILADSVDVVDSVLEIGTGSGAVGIWLAAAGYTRTATLTDIDPVAVNVASANVSEASLGNRITVLHSDMFACVPTGVTYDRVIFNPPLWHKAERGEGELALVDVNGIIAREFLELAGRYLNEQGEIWITYSNLSNPKLMEDVSDKWQFTLMLAEYLPATGLFKFAYKGKRKT